MDLDILIEFKFNFFLTILFAHFFDSDFFIKASLNLSGKLFVW